MTSVKFSVYNSHNDLDLRMYYSTDGNSVAVDCFQESDWFEAIAGIHDRMQTQYRDNWGDVELTMENRCLGLRSCDSPLEKDTFDLMKEFLTSAGYNVK